MPIATYYRPPAPTSLYPVNNTAIQAGFYNGLEISVAAEVVTYTGGTGVQTIYDITGPGIIGYLGVFSNAVTAAQTIVVTIDGVEVYNGDPGLNANNNASFFGDMVNTAASVYGQTYVSAPFYNKLEVTCTSTANRKFAANYYLTG